MDQRVVGEIRALAKKHRGFPSAELLVEFAKNPRTACHKRFDWNDKVAGHKWRVEQARDLLQSVKVEIKTTQFSIKAPEFVRNPRAKASEQGYVSLGVLRSDEDLAREAVIAEFSRASAALARAKAIATALGLSNEVEALLSQVTALSARIEDAAVGAA